MNLKAIAWNVGLLGAGALVASVFTGQPTPAHSAPVAKGGFDLVLLVQVGDDEDEYVIDGGLRAGECTVAARNLAPSYRTYRNTPIRTSYACVRR